MTGRQARRRLALGLAEVVDAEAIDTLRAVRERVARVCVLDADMAGDSYSGCWYNTHKYTT